MLRPASTPRLSPSLNRWKIEPPWRAPVSCITTTKRKLRWTALQSKKFSHDPTSPGSLYKRRAIRPSLAQNSSSWKSAQPMWLLTAETTSISVSPTKAPAMSAYWAKAVGRSSQAIWSSLQAPRMPASRSLTVSWTLRLTMSLISTMAPCSLHPKTRPLSLSISSTRRLLLALN